MNVGETKKTKYGKWVIAVILILATFLGILYSQMGPNSQANKEFEKQNGEETAALTDKLVGEVENIDTQGIREGTVEEAATKVVLPSSEQTVIDQELAKMTDAEKQKLLQTLAENYNAILYQQKAEAIGMLENLIRQGKSEWESLKSAGQATAATKAEKAAEYMAMVNTMEQNMDASVAAVLASMEKQLKAEGIDSAPIIELYRANYEKIKEANRSAMMDKALSAIKG